jgi:hypothetical protein
MAFIWLLLPAFESWVVALYKSHVRFFVSFSKLIFCIIEEVAPLLCGILAENLLLYLELIVLHVHGSLLYYFSR